MTNDEFKRTLWEAADKLRGSVAAATYKYPVLGLVFLKYVSDMFDEVCEYFLGQFALKEGARAGEFSTPKSVVNLLVEILAPFKGTIYDPACGSGGMFVQSARFKDAHAAKLKKKGDLAIHGQEMMAATRHLALMNLAVNGMHGDLGAAYGNTFHNDQHNTLRAAYVLTNPPFNISDWGGDRLTDDRTGDSSWAQDRLSRGE